MVTFEAVGGQPGTGGQVGVLLDAGGIKFVLPTTAQRLKKAGQMTVQFSIEVQAARYRIDGVNPAAGTGVLLPTGFYTVSGEALIAAYTFISAVAGSTLNYQFSYGATA
jgi:hypothetical protein